MEKPKVGKRRTGNRRQEIETQTSIKGQGCLSLMQVSRLHFKNRKVAKISVSYT